MRRLTELECTVLGLIGQHGPCTAYQVRQLFQQSPTSTWRASTGSIYPLVEKLVRRSLLEARACDSDRRKTRLLNLTVAGQTALEQWLLDSPPGIADPSADPIRTRLLFIGSLAPAEQLVFVRQALELTAESILSLGALIATIPAQEQYEHFVHDGALRQLEARRRWLENVRDSLGAL